MRHSNRLRIINIIIYSAVLLAVFQLPVFCQSDERNTLKQKVELNYTNTTFIYVIAQLARTYELPIGLEKSLSEKSSERFNIAVKGKTLEEVLDLLVKQEKLYKWELKGGTINFTPIYERSPFLETFLQTPINKFTPKNGLSKSEMRDTLLILPEVSDLLFSYQIKAVALDQPGLKLYKNDDNLSISNTTVRGVLNNLVEKSEYKIWVVEMYGKNKDKLVISF